MGGLLGEPFEVGDSLVPTGWKCWGTTALVASTDRGIETGTTWFNALGVGRLDLHRKVRDTWNDAKWRRAKTYESTRTSRVHSFSPESHITKRQGALGGEHRV